MKIINLIENTSNANHIKCEHGLSFAIELNKRLFLYDVGQSDKFIHNARAMGLDLSHVEAVILSHGHYDHTGGLPAFLELNKRARIFMHPKALKERYSTSSSMLKYNGIAWTSLIPELTHRISLIEKCTALAPGINIITAGPTNESTWKADHRLVCKEGEHLVEDHFEDELTLLLQSDDKNVLLTGCGHRGIENILHEVKQQSTICDYELIAGGLHLMGQTEKDIQSLISKLSPYRVKRWALNHCTGEEAIRQFSKAGFHTERFKGGESLVI